MDLIFEIHLQKIHCFDEADSVGSAEPYLWAIFFKIDGDSVFIDELFNLQGTAKVFGTLGDHGNLGVSHVGKGDDIVIPAQFGYSDFLRPIPLRQPVLDKHEVSGIVGCIVVLMEQDNTSDEAVAAGHAELRFAVQSALNELITSLHQEPSPEEIEEISKEIKDKVGKQVKDAITNRVLFFGEIAAGLNDDDQIGSGVFLFSQDDLLNADPGGIFFEARVKPEGDKNEGDWQITGIIQSSLPQLHLSGVTSDGHLWHTIRDAFGRWVGFGDVEGPAGDRGLIVDVDLQSVGKDVHLCAINSSGGLWHAIRLANSSWVGFGDVESQADDRGSFVRVGLAEVNAELHVCGATSDGHLWHTIRRANGLWLPFEDVEGQAGDRGSFTDVDCTGVIVGVSSELHVCGVTSDGHLWHAIRRNDGSWIGFGDVKSQAGDRGTIQDVACAGVADELHVCAVSGDGRLWHAIRRRDGSWIGFGDVKSQTGDRGSFRSVSVDGLFVP